MRIVALLEWAWGCRRRGVLNQGIQFHTSLSFGAANAVIGLARALRGLGAGEPPGIGTVANAVLVGIFIELLLAVPR